MPKEKREPRKHQLDAGSKNGQLEKVKDWLIKNQKPHSTPAFPILMLQIGKESFPRQKP